MPTIQAPNTQELAPARDTVALMVDPYLKIMANPDTILSAKGAGNFDVYREVHRDDQVKSTFQQRRLATVQAPWTVEPGAKDATSKAAAEALSANLAAINFDNITELMLYSIFYGYGVAEVMWEQRDNMVAISDVLVRDRSRFRFGLNGALYIERPGFRYDELPDRKFWVMSTGADNSDNPYGLGLAHWLYWPTYFKRMDIKFWLIFLEKFGQPTPVGKLPPGMTEDQETRRKLLTALRSVATDAAVVVPDGCEINLLEAARSGAADYETLHRVMNEAISKIVLSQTMTTDNGSSKSQSETHAGVRDKVVKADADLLCASFNRQVVKWWCEYNFPNAVPPVVRRVTEPPEDMTERANRDNLIYKLGYEPDENYIKDTYGPGWSKRQAPAVAPPGAGAFGQDPQATNFTESLALAALKASGRQDQQSLVESAQAFANQYEGVIGTRVQQLIDYAENSGDYETFRKHLLGMLAEGPTQQTINKIERGNFFARLLGAWRAQR